MYMYWGVKSDGMGAELKISTPYLEYKHNYQGSHWPGKSGKTFKKKWSGNFLFFPKVRELFKNADCHENKKYWDFHLKHVAIIISCYR